jgi:hypothetical protein
MNTISRILALGLMVSCALPFGAARAQTDSRAWARQAAFVFSGEAEPQAKLDPREFVAPPGAFAVRVLDVLYVKPPASVKAGDTVIVAPYGDAREPIAPGTRAVFYANGWIYGKHLSVREIGRTPLERSTARTKREIAEAKTEAENDRIVERIAAAELVIAGKVRSVRPFDEANRRVPISEHAADWRLAEIAVAKRYKGQSETTVLVAFPASRDVMWAESPKFKEGQEGIWILQRPRNLEQIFSSAKAPVFTAIAARDFRPKSDADRIVRLLKATQSH